ncbi:SRPBCC family protein [Cyanobium gracile UHCC 0139]|uniref:SRPBCC family protein n=1 Tax=Cyanobium gracile UHCC 0139 TaxID=3110308 RepID=A0ABU5RWS5_9CYAN|nr:SRPBCC family protein [Cyanobium gracile]MEA5392158.1 SRPBCC family protein [Cyanobium gracile UHCC 0139]
MWTHRFETTTDLTPEELWPVLADVPRWPEVDHGIERLVIRQEPGPGVTFTLKPKGGPTLSFRIGHFEAPTRYSDLCRLPLATMETVHELVPGPSTTVRVRLAIQGPLAPLWGRLVGRTHAAGLPLQTDRMVARARELASPRRDGVGESPRAARHSAPPLRRV